MKLHMTGSPRVTLSQAKRMGASKRFKAGRRDYSEFSLDLELEAALYQQHQRCLSTFDRWAAKRREEWAAEAKRRQPDNVP